MFGKNKTPSEALRGTSHQEHARLADNRRMQMAVSNWEKTAAEANTHALLAIYGVLAEIQESIEALGQRTADPSTAGPGTAP